MSNAAKQFGQYAYIYRPTIEIMKYDIPEKLSKVSSAIFLKNNYRLYNE